MAWVAVHKDGSESIFDIKPRRVDRFWSDEFYINDDVRWDSEIELPKGSIKKLIDRDLTWSDEPVELKEDK